MKIETVATPRHIQCHLLKTMTHLFIIKPTRCINFSNLFLELKSTCFRQFLCLSLGVFHCTHSNGICHRGLPTACERDQDVPSLSHAVSSLENYDTSVYNKTKQMHQFLKFIFGMKLYMFQTVPLSIIRSFSLYTQQWHMSYRLLSANLYDIYVRQEFFTVHTAMVYVIQVAVSKPV